MGTSDLGEEERETERVGGRERDPKLDVQVHMFSIKIHCLFFLLPAGHVSSGYSHVN